MGDAISPILFCVAGVPAAGTKQYRKVVRMVQMGLTEEPDWLPSRVVWPHLADVLE